MSEWAERFNLLTQALLQSPSLAIALTLAAYFVGIYLFRVFGSRVWTPPILISATLLAGSLALAGVDYNVYRGQAQWLTVLLGPATVALGVPLYQQIHHIRALWRPIVFTLPLAATLAALYALGLAAIFGASPEVLASLAPKSVTAPIAIGITEQLGGSVPLMMGGLLVTGVVATLCVDFLGRRLKIADERILGLALGLNGHAIGTARAFEISPAAGAFASLGMGLTGIFTALMLPFAFRLWLH